jgi:hypothetical protein
MDNIYTIQDIMNKLFCTFTSQEDLEETLNTIQNHYSILYGKIFILEADDRDELLCTYNIDPNNSNTKIIPNTILLHRKKETNTLYTINALNLLIKELNEGVVDPRFKIEWTDYKNTVLLTQGSDLKKLQTKINKIISI